MLITSMLTSMNCQTRPRVFALEIVFKEESRRRLQKMEKNQENIERARLEQMSYSKNEVVSIPESQRELIRIADRYRDYLRATGEVLPEPHFTSAERHYLDNAATDIPETARQDSLWDFEKAKFTLEMLRPAEDNKLSTSKGGLSVSEREARIEKLPSLMREEHHIGTLEGILQHNFADRDQVKSQDMIGIHEIEVTRISSYDPVKERSLQGDFTGRAGKLDLPIAIPSQQSQMGSATQALNEDDLQVNFDYTSQQARDSLQAWVREITGATAEIDSSEQEVILDRTLARSPSDQTCYLQENDRTRAGQLYAELLVNSLELNILHRAGEDTTLMRRSNNELEQEYRAAETEHVKQYGGQPLHVMTQEQYAFLSEHKDDSIFESINDEIKRSLNEAVVIGASLIDKSLERSGGDDHAIMDHDF